ncbi:MAG: hypothetical protein LBS69_03830 [Prevotellaceae bacterium]|jgi:CBS domain containing-hemolysin-like protein|nr:hypothetical protein [Prevotellaceae bacterium]
MITTNGFAVLPRAGRKIYIVKDDAGNVIGVADCKDLMEKIPNKIKNLSGIAAEVNLLQEDGAPVPTVQVEDLKTIPSHFSKKRVSKAVVLMRTAATIRL